MLALLAAAVLPSQPDGPKLVFCCRADNDLYVAVNTKGRNLPRFATVSEAFGAVKNGGSVLILADRYPELLTPISRTDYEAAEQRHLRLFVEYPATDIEPLSRTARSAGWERAVVATDAFGPRLPKLQILALHGCQFVPSQAKDPWLVMARVAGFDRAVFGLPEKTSSLLFEDPARHVLIAETKLSNFATARYAPSDAIRIVWQRIFRWLDAPELAKSLEWKPSVRPTYGAADKLPATAEKEAALRGAEWFTKARMLIAPSWQHAYDEAFKYEDRVGLRPSAGWPSGDGSLGVLEGFNAVIGTDGSQRARWWVRADCNGEAAMAMALAGKLAGDPVRQKVGANLCDFLYFNSIQSQGERANPSCSSYGLVGWNNVARYYGNADGYKIFYGDDNARMMLGTMAAAGALNSDRWDVPILRCLLANLRTTGTMGFRGDSLYGDDIEKNGWRHYWNAPTINMAPHFEAYLWACDMWAFHHTAFRPFFDRPMTAIKMLMEKGPDAWRWTNGSQQEKARMLLPLAWLVRVADTPEHRDWLRRMADDLLSKQDACGAIAEALGVPGKGIMPPPASNEAYGTAEAPLIQENGDKASDLLYTTNFALLGLHEAAAATGDPRYKAAEDRLVKFLCRIQVRSEKHPYLDGAWFRAFDFKNWEYWASNADAGWGAWSIESGWTQSWIVSILAMRQMKTSLWDLTSRTQIGKQLPVLRPLMIPDDALGG